MVVVLRNNFDGGPAGTVVTAANSGYGENDPFDFVSTQGTGCVLQYADAAALERGTAEFVLKMDTGSTAVGQGVVWTTSMGTKTQVWWRVYIYLASLTASVNLPIFESDNGVAFTGMVQIYQGTGLVSVTNGAETVQDISTNGLVAGQWARLECHLTYSTTVGAGEVLIFLEPDSDTPTETIGISGCNMGAASSNTYAWGYVFARANLPAMYMSGFELNDSGYPGPAPFKMGHGVPGVLSNPIAIHTDTW